MSRLFTILFSMAAMTLGGTGVIIALTLGLDRIAPIVVAAGIGVGLAVPVAWIVTRRLS